ncbi:hypothetical protein EON65_30670 [archaeon]|nr:MAG: hypothetical protein EON65_30670 [archaeon]
MKRRKAIYSPRLQLSHDVDSMYQLIFPRLLPADRLVTLLSLSVRTAEMSAAVTAAEARHLCLPASSINDVNVISRNTMSIYKRGINMASSRLKYLGMLPAKPSSRQTIDLRIDLPSNINIYRHDC